MKCMVRPIALLQREERKPETLGGQMLREKEVNYPTQLFFFSSKRKMCGAGRVLLEGDI